MGLRNNRCLLNRNNEEQALPPLGGDGAEGGWGKAEAEQAATESADSKPSLIRPVGHLLPQAGEGLVPKLPAVVRAQFF